MSDDSDSSQDERDQEVTKVTPGSDKYCTPEEIKKQKQRDKKKNKRKKKRQLSAISRNEEEKEDGTEEGEDNEKKEHPMTVSETVKALQEEQRAIEDLQPKDEDGRPKKKVYGVQIDLSTLPKGNNPHYDPTMDKFTRSTEGEQSANELVLTETKKQHRGLRCSRCFSLLCRDDDFEYMNGQLNVTGEALKSSWDGLIMRGGMVYCQKMHLVGYKKHVTFTNKSKSVVALKVEKTTFTENYTNNPAFANTDKIRNKLQFQERGGNDGMWRQLSLPPKQYIPTEFAPADRYHGNNPS